MIADGFPLWWHILVNDLTGAQTQRFVNAFNTLELAPLTRTMREQIKSAASGRHGVTTFRGRSFLSMGVVKDDDHAITWDAEAMAQRAFLEVRP